MLSWNQAIDQMRASGLARAVYMRTLVQHPRDAGMVPAVDVSSGQRATYSLKLADGEALFVYDYGTSYLARLVRVRPPAHGVELALQTRPGSSVLGATTIGALLGLALGGSKESTLVGAIVGGMVGLSAVSVANAESSPATTRASNDVLHAAVKAMQARSVAPHAVFPTSPAKAATPLGLRKRAGTAGSARVPRRST